MDENLNGASFHSTSFKEISDRKNYQDYRIVVPKVSCVTYLCMVRVCCDRFNVCYPIVPHILILAGPEIYDVLNSTAITSWLIFDIFANAPATFG